MRTTLSHIIAFASCYALGLMTAFGQGSVFSQKDFRRLSQLTGTWRGGTSRVESYESWKPAGENALSGTSYRIVGGVRKELETVRLFLRNGRIVYAPTAAGQNDEQEVPFPLVAIKDNEYLFENPAHDFPTRISYKFVGADSLHAYIEGKQGEKTVKVYFNYIRVQQK